MFLQYFTLEFYLSCLIIAQKIILAKFLTKLQNLGRPSSKETDLVLIHLSFVFSLINYLIKMLKYSKMISSNKKNI